jgi:uncharacterized protein HemX
MDTNNQTKNSTGAVIGAIIVIIILVAGGFYFYGQRVEKQKQFEAMKATAQQSAAVGSDINALLNEASSTTPTNLGDGINNL